MKRVASFLISLQLCNAYSQDSENAARYTTADTMIRAAGIQYQASGWKRFWWGDHYRREWATPVSFPVLRISSMYGGLTPLKSGGGHQTKTLRLLDADGKEYVLRSVDKTLDLLVPDYFKNTYVHTVVNDQISTAHPYGPIAIAKLAEAIELPRPNPKTYYVAADPALGKFNEIFANKLAMLEERPSGKGWEQSTLFGEAADIVNTEKMLEKVFASSKNSVDQKAFLKVRLFDMVINDWDRHEDQWVWAVKKGDDKNLYMPIGRDRDQAFSRTDGLGLFFITLPWVYRIVKNFGPTIHDVKGFNFMARNLDQQFLNELTRDEWISVINAVRMRMTNEEISKAVDAMPAEVNKYSGMSVKKRLRQRRDNLSSYGMKYYKSLSEKITINGSAKDESFIIDLSGPDEASVTGLRYPSNDTFYHRIFYRKETREINLYGLQGDDKYFIKGYAKNRFVLRLIGGEGENQYSSDMLKIPGRKPLVYDSLPAVVSGNIFRAKNWDTVYRYKRASVKTDYFIPVIRPGFNADDGFSIDLGILYRRRQWGKEPFGWEQQLAISYASGTGAVGFQYAGLFKNTFGKWDMEFNSFYKGPRYTFFYYGLGNESVLKNYSRRFYRVKANDFFVSPGISRSWDQNNLRFGLQFESVEIFRDQNKFITTPGSDADTIIFDVNNFAGVYGSYNFSNLDHRRFPRRGFDVITGFSFMNNLDNTDRRFIKLNGSFSVYHTMFKKLTIAHRTGAAINVGEFDFYHGNFLGLDHNLRGFYKSRFTGRSAIFQNTELRYTAFDLKGYYVKGLLGIYGFFDDGRVWIRGEKSTSLHVSYGGGVYFLPFQAMAFTLYYAGSKEADLVVLKAGFFF